MKRHYNKSLLILFAIGGILFNSTPMHSTVSWRSLYNPLVPVSTLFIDIQNRIEKRVASFKNNIKKHYGSHCKNTYKGRVAQVRTDTQLCPEEKVFIERRKPKVKKALEKLLGRELEDDNVPTIAFVFSGGGYRSMIYTMGALCGAEDTGLLDTAMYVSGLSGSCWALGTWMNSNKSLKEHTQSLVTKMGWGLHKVTYAQAQLIGKALMLKYAYGQPISLVDMYGGLLGNALFADAGNARHFMYLSDQLQKIKDGSLPFPLYSLAIWDANGTQRWAECTPCEFSCPWLECSVPIWAMGRKFFNGVSLDYAPEQSLSALFGVFGSAFAATFNRAYQDIKDKINPGFIKRVVDSFFDRFGNNRLTYGAVLHNMMLGIPNTPLCKQQKLYVADAGIDFNLGYPALSGQHLNRKADILIFINASTFLKNGRDLKKVERYAQQYNLPFPDIDYTDIDKRAVSIFKDENNKNAPVVIYLPRVKNEKKWNEHKDKSAFDLHKKYLEGFDPDKCSLTGFGTTSNFVYTRDQAKTWQLLADFNIKTNKEEILEIINWAIDNKMSKS